MALQLPCRARQAVELRQARLSVWVGGPGAGWGGGGVGWGGGGESRTSSTASRSSTALHVAEHCLKRVATVQRVARPPRAAGALGLAARPAGGGQLALASVPPRRAAAAAGGLAAIQ